MMHNFTYTSEGRDCQLPLDSCVFFSVYLYSWVAMYNSQHTNTIALCIHYFF